MLQSCHIQIATKNGDVSGSNWMQFFIQIVFSNLKGYNMNKYLLVSTMLAVLGLTACDRPTVVVPSTPVVVPSPVAVPGPAGPQGATGSQGAEGAKGDTGKTGAGGNSAVVVVPVEPPPAK